MTKKNYRAIGKALRSVEFLEPLDSDTGEIVDECIRQIAFAIANVFEQDNPRFDRQRFLRFVETGKDTRR